MFKHLFRRKEKEKTLAMNTINLLAGILVHYPEISTVQYDPISQCLQFSYTIDEALLKSLEVPELFIERDLFLGIQGYHRFNKIYSQVTEVEIEHIAPFANVVIRRDLKSFSPREISFILALLAQTIPGFFAIDGMDRRELEDLAMGEEPFSVRLENVNNVSGQREIVAFRDKERVLFYNK